MNINFSDKIYRAITFLLMTPVSHLHSYIHVCLNFKLSMLSEISMYGTTMMSCICTHVYMLTCIIIIISVCFQAGQPSPPTAHAPPPAVSYPPPQGPPPGQQVCRVHDWRIKTVMHCKSKGIGVSVTDLENEFYPH